MHVLLCSSFHDIAESASYGLSVIVYTIMYLSFYTTLHIDWLLRYIKLNLRKPTSEACLLDNKYQENIRCHLKEVAKYHINFKESFYTLGKIQDSATLLLCISGLMMAVPTTYFLLSESQESAIYEEEDNSPVTKPTLKMTKKIVLTTAAMIIVIPVKMFYILKIIHHDHLRLR
ncbi:unnamed protein product [Diabrotica balteata]|uniref:Uncharacterized protein n=1 Tax=Diabrotica balteata TaxID=107213 RepID=A0A9N9X6N2_DIABA|nr:unnamed protein product [Diabrotica balteata]